MNTAPIRFMAPVTIAATAKGPRRFDAVVYTGGALEIGGWELPVVVDLAGLTTRKSVTANLDHDPTKRVGHVDQVSNDGRQLLLGGVVSAANSSAAEFLAAHDQGYPWQASIEAAPKQVDTVRAGESVEVNGQKFDGPVYVTRKGVLVAVGFVPNGADDSTSVSIAAQKAKAMAKQSDFREWLAEMNTNADLLTADQLATCHAQYSGRREPTEADRVATLPMIAASADPVAAESHRLKQISNACDDDWGDESDRVNELQKSAITGEIDVDELLNHLRTIRGEIFMTTAPKMHSVYRPDPNHGGKCVEASLCLAGGLTNPEKHFDEQTLEIADRMQSSVSLGELLIGEATRRGYSSRPGERLTQGNLRSVLTAALAPDIKAGGFSTLSLPNVLSNVANKFLREGFESVDQTALRISALKSVRNFKTATTISLTGGMQFEQLGKDAELKHGTVGEETYTNKADTYGTIFAITRQDLINDDTDALSAVPRRIGRGGMLKLNDLVWSLFLNNAAFFTSGRGNLAEAGSALGNSGGSAINLAETLFLNQTDPDGNPLGVMPSILLVPPTLRATAFVLMNSQLTITGSDVIMPNANIWRGRFSVESSPYMENDSYTGYSATAWYLLAHPSQLPVIEIAALNGKVEPTVESAEADFSQLGIQMRGYSDVGVAMVEYRGGVRATGQS